MRITTEYSELLIMALDDANINYMFDDEIIIFSIPDDVAIPHDVSNAMQLVRYAVS